MYLFTKSNLKNAVKCFLQNCHFKLGNGIFMEIIGISMDSDFNNLFLHYYYSIWIRSLSKPYIGGSRRFVNVFRFIDDLIAINDGENWDASDRDFPS